MTALQAPLEHSPQDADTAPALGKDAARAVIAARLRALGHPSDLLDPQAIAALIEHAGGSGVRLRAALAATLFLASTEDAPRIGRTLVNRALQESGDILAAPPAPATPARRRFLVPGAAAIVGTVLAVTLLVLRPSSRPPPAEPSQTMQPRAEIVPRGPQAAQTLPPPPPIATSPPSVPLQEAAKTPAPMPPPPAVVAPIPTPAPANAAPAPGPVAKTVVPPAPPDLPAAPPTSVVLMVSARDPATAAKLDSLIRHLRSSGVTQVVTQPSSGRARRPISYFFADDLPLAQSITQILAREEWPRLVSNSLTPRLVVPPAGMPPRQPGLIEIQLP